MKIAITGARGRVMERLIRSMAPGTMAVLDLEDGYLDVRDTGDNDESERPPHP